MRGSAEWGVPVAQGMGTAHRFLLERPERALLPTLRPFPRRHPITSRPADASARIACAPIPSCPEIGVGDYSRTIYPRYHAPMSRAAQCPRDSHHAIHVATICLGSLLLASMPAHAQRRLCHENPARPGICEPVPGTGAAGAGRVLFSVGYTFSAVVGVIGIAACGGGHTESCPLILSFVPVVGPMTAVAWSAAVTPPASASEGLTYLFIGAAFFSALEVVGAALTIGGSLREWHANTTGERAERPRWALMPGPGAMGLSLVIRE